MGGQHRTRVRFVILALISVGTMINYLVSNLSCDGAAYGFCVGGLFRGTSFSLLGAFSYIFILGDVRRIELENEAAER